MNKVVADTYWVMAGRWRGERPRLVERSWLTSILPPFYRGVGVQVRVGPWSLRFGVCYPRMPVTVDPYGYVDMQENLDALLGYEMDESNKEIRRWGSSTEAATEPVASTPTSSGASSAGSPSATSST